MSDTQQKTLIEQANNIIDQDAHTADDITRLQRIKRHMAKLYAQGCEELGKQETHFQKARTTTYVKSMKAGKTDSQSKEAGRYSAEQNRGTFRLFEQYIKGMLQQIKSIESFCIDYYHKNNQEKQALISGQEHTGN